MDNHVKTKAHRVYATYTRIYRYRLGCGQQTYHYPKGQYLIKCSDDNAFLLEYVITSLKEIGFANVNWL
jgi:hypothetical protein